MRLFTPAIMTALRSGEQRAFVLFLMVIDGVDYGYTDCDVPLVYDSVTYEPRGLMGSVISYGNGHIVDQCSFDIDNLDDRLTPAFVGGTPQGSPVFIRMVRLDQAYTIIPDPALLFEGEIGPWDKPRDLKSIAITVTNDLSRWNQTTMALHSASCRWKVFGGEECGYAGVENWCDRTYSRCEALGNTDDFGGFRWLPSIMDIQIWWGRVQGEEMVS